MRTYSFQMDVQVTDAREAYRAARKNYLQTGVAANTPVRAALKDVHNALGTLAEPDEGACVQWLCDPGMSPDGLYIVESSVLGYLDDGENT